jgi:hypothetical protein
MVLRTTSNPTEQNKLEGDTDMPIRRCLEATLLLCTAFISTQSQAQIATTTAISIVASGNQVSTISTGTAVTLMATVTGGGSKLTQGQVNFCNAAAAHCTDVNVLGTAAITSAGSAALVLRPGPGIYSYKAEFSGTPGGATHYGASASSAAALTVTGANQSLSVMAAPGGAPGNYTLTALVYGFNKSKSTPAPTGSVVFVDSTTGNSALGTAALTASALGPYLLNSSNIPTASGVGGGIVSGDFNNDGNLDYAIGVVGGISPLEVFLGDGQGGFQAVAESPLAASGSPFVVADFNRDGKLDILLSNSSSGPSQLTVLLGKGDGTFSVASGSPFYTNYGAAPLVSADFNGDGIPDVAVAGGYYVVVLLGKGDGSFVPLPTSASMAPAYPLGGMVTGDFNHDGKEDIAASSSNSTAQTVLVYLGNGDGTFVQGTPIDLSNQIGGSSVNIDAGDFNGDGNLDLATPVYGNPGAVAVYLGKGDGSFTAASGSPFPTATLWANVVKVGDFNGDGVADLYVTGTTNMQDLAIHLSNGDGTFTLVPTANTPNVPCCFWTTLADFNHDGVTDIAAASFYDNQANLYLTALTQSTGSSSGISVVGVTPQQVLASYSGDGVYSGSESATTPLEVQAVAPTITPGSGTIGELETITMSTTTPGSTIYYTFSGAFAGLVPYGGPFQHPYPGTVTLQAYATSPGYGQSATTTVTYTIVLPSPVPAIATLSPGFARNGAAALTLTVTGSSFVSTSVVYWGTTALATQFVSATQITAQLPASALAGAGITPVSVQNPAPGGGTSNSYQFEVDSGNAAAAPTFASTTASVAAGGTASYVVTLPSSATNVSGNCLNLPMGATCSYAASGTLSIATSSSTPKGTYAITAVFTETLPTTFSGMLWAPFLLLPGALLRLRRKQRWFVFFFILTVSSLLVSGCGGSSGGGSKPPPTQQLTSSATLTLQVQ